MSTGSNRSETQSGSQSRPRRLSLWIKGCLLSLTVPLLLVAAFDMRRPKLAYLPAVAVSFGAVGLLAIKRREGGLLDRLATSNTTRRLEAVLTTSVVSVFAMEGALALFDRVSPHPMLTPRNVRSQDLIERNREASKGPQVDGASVNTAGYNDTEWVVPKPEGAVRILALGDSFAFGCVGYEGNFLTILEKELRTSVSQNVEVINMGLPGLSPAEYRQLLREEGLALDPDLVLVCFFTGNDFIRLKPRTLFRLTDWRLPAFIQCAFRLIRDRAGKEDASPSEQESGNRPDVTQALERRESTPSFSEESYRRICSEYLPLLARSMNADSMARARDTLSLLDGIADDAAGVPVVVAVLPNEVQVRETWRAEVCAWKGVDPTSLDMDTPYRTLKEHLQRRDVQVLDLLPPLLEAEKDQPTYLPRDSHWNRRGNDVVGRSLSQALEAQVRALLSR